MKPYSELTRSELIELEQRLFLQYEDMRARGLKLNMARGLPSAEQLDMEADFFGILYPDSEFISEEGKDCRNYGELTGIHEARRLMGQMMEIKSENVIVFGNSSLNVMYDTVARSMVLVFADQRPGASSTK